MTTTATGPAATDILPPDALAAIGATSARHVEACAWLAASPDNALGRYRVLATRDAAAASLASDIPALLASLAAERTRREAAEAECARLRADLEATERARQAAEEERDTALELVAPDAMDVARQRDDRDAARLGSLVVVRVALADAELILEERERQLTAALTAVAAERARCAAVCREVAMFYDAPDAQAVVAHACADEIERGAVGR